MGETQDDAYDGGDDDKNCFQHRVARLQIDFSLVPYIRGMKGKKN